MRMKPSFHRSLALFAVCFLLLAVCISRAQKPELVVQTGHSFSVYSVSLSSDGKYLVTGSEDKTAKLWEVATGKEIRTFRGHSYQILSVSLSSDGKYLVTGSGDKTAKLWEVATGQEIRTFSGHSDKVWSVCLSSDGKYLVTGSGDMTVKLWEVATGQEFHTIGEHFDMDYQFSLSSDGKYLVTGSDDNTAKLWEVATGKEIRTFRGHSSLVHSVSLSHDGKYLVTGSGDKTAKLWEVATGQEIRTFRGHSSLVHSVSLSHDGKYLVTGSVDNTAKLWEVATGKEIRTFRGHFDGVFSVSLSSDGKYLVTGSYSTTKLWEVATGQEIRTFDGHSFEVGSVSLSIDGKYLVTGSGDGTAKLWEVATGQEIHTFEGHSEYVTSVSLSRDGKYLVTGSGDKTAKLWEVATGQKIHTFGERTFGVYSVSLSSDGKYLATGSEDNTAKLWEVATGQEIRTFDGYSENVTSVSLSHDGKYLVTGSGDGTAKLWEVATGQEIHTFEGHSEYVTSVSLSRDGKYLVTGSYDHTAKLWEVGTGQEIRTFRGHIGSVRSVSLSSDGEYLVTGSGDGTAMLWKVATGQEIRTFFGHSFEVGSVSLSIDGKYLVTGSWDNTAKLWDVATGKGIRTFYGHFNGVNSVSLSSDGKYLVTGSDDATTKIWEMNTGREIATLISLGENDWAVTTPDGLFDASSRADQYLHFVKNLEIIELNQLKERYYEPGLLAKLMGFNKEPLQTVKAFTAEELYPEIALTEPQATDCKLKIHLSNRGGGIGRVIVFVNGKEISNDARAANADPNAKEMQLAVNLADHPYLVPGKENTIEVKAFNAEGYLSSRNVRVVYQAPAKPKIEPPTLWAIVAGVSDYRGEQIDLRYAAKDAVDFAHALQIGAKRLFGVERLHLKLLTTEASPEAVLPSKANLVQAFQEMAKAAKSTDILVVYLAGHGVNYGGPEGDFYYLLNEARSGDLNDPEVRKLAALSSAELTELVKQVPALKQVLILDTCASGRLVEKLTDKRDISSSTIRAFERMKDRTGMYVLAGAAADAVSYEASRYGQGLLTYSLLLGMRGAALRDDEFIDISKLFQFSADQVPELAKDIGGIQKPIVAAPYGGTSFDIGRLISEDKPQIPLATPRPLVLRANFQDEERFIDRLNLTTLVNNQLRELSARGREAQFIFVDAAEFAEAYSLAGRYRSEGDKLHVSVRLFRGEQKVGEFAVVGNPMALEPLIQDILKAVASQLIQAAPKN